MLVSPLMGPILGTTFGYAVRDGHLVRRGFKSTFLGLLTCVVLGYLFGLFWTPLVSQYWPTNCNNVPIELYSEMCNRGVLSSVWTSATVAVPSGMGVALSMLGSNTAGLVGVAISASLLPPAVNCGMLLAYASIGNDYRNDTTELDDSILASAGISLLITVVNIVCIYIFGILTFRIKEIAPFPNKSDFWKDAVPFYRDLSPHSGNPDDHGCCGGKFTKFCDAFGCGFIFSFSDKIKKLREYKTDFDPLKSADDLSTKKKKDDEMPYDPLQFLRLGKVTKD